MSVTVARITVDGVVLEVASGVSVAAALMNAELPIRASVAGESRSALCGMGICQECRVTIDGRAHQRSCLTAVRDGMVVTRDD
jgi:predicted molibdopterin-dependent oxidoreductase YjgC